MMWKRQRIVLRFSSILTPQGKYLFEFFIIKLKDSYLIECEKEWYGRNY